MFGFIFLYDLHHYLRVLTVYLLSRNSKNLKLEIKKPNQQPTYGIHKKSLLTISKHNYLE